MDLSGGTSLVSGVTQKGQSDLRVQTTVILPLVWFLRHKGIGLGALGPGQAPKSTSKGSRLTAGGKTARSLVPSKKYSIMGGIWGYFGAGKSSRSCTGRDCDRVQISFLLLLTSCCSLLSRKTAGSPCQSSPATAVWDIGKGPGTWRGQPASPGTGMSAPHIPQGAA